MDEQESKLLCAAYEQKGRHVSKYDCVFSIRGVNQKCCKSIQFLIVICIFVTDLLVSLVQERSDAR